MPVTTKEQACKATTLFREDKKEPLLRSLQEANVQAVSDISGSLGCPKTKGKPEWRYNLQSDGPAIAAAMTRYINSATAPANIKDMVAKAKSYGPSILAKMDPPVVIKEEDTQIRVRFNWTTQSAYVKDVFGDGHWNAYFNLDVGNAGFAQGVKDPATKKVKGKEFQEIVAITFHTKIDVKNRGYEGSFHLKQKVGPSPQTTIRYRICKQAGNKITISEAYTLNKGKEVKDLISPFDTLVREALEDYLNNACTVPVVPRPPPPPPKAPSPKAPSPKAPSPKAPSPKAPSPKAPVFAKGMNPFASEFKPYTIKNESVVNPKPVVIPGAVKPTVNESTMKKMEDSGISNTILKSFNLKSSNKATNTTRKNTILTGLVTVKKKENNNMNAFRGTKKNTKKEKLMAKSKETENLASSMFRTGPIAAVRARNNTSRGKKPSGKGKSGTRTRKNRS